MRHWTYGVNVLQQKTIFFNIVWDRLGVSFPQFASNPEIHGNGRENHMDYGVGRATVAPGLTDSYLSKMDVAVATKNLTKSVWSTCTEKKVVKGLKSCWKGSSASFPNLLPVLRAVERLHEEIVGIGVWLCFICCPLQGGSNLQPAHDPINPNACPLNLNPRKLFCLDLGPGKQWHYQLDT